MPLKMIDVPAELFLEHTKLNIYHTYKNNDVNSDRSWYCFVLDKFGNDYDGFDVRDLRGWKEPSHPPFLKGKDDTLKNKKAWTKYHSENKLENHIKKFLKKCINNGILKQKKY